MCVLSVLGNNDCTKKLLLNCCFCGKKPSAFLLYLYFLSFVVSSGVSGALELIIVIYLGFVSLERCFLFGRLEYAAWFLLA